MDMMSMTAVELGKKIKAGEISVMEATKACIENIKTYDKEYNCFITVDEEGAFKQAEEIQKKIDSGELTGPLAGVPIAIKDNMCQNGVLTTCASKILSNFVPTYTSDAVVKLMEAGAVIVGKTKCTLAASRNFPREAPHFSGSLLVSKENIPALISPHRTARTPVR